jgi:2'-hydroxyisoflavone reductase
MRILILGGSGFSGPFYVREALTRGHEVTVFNRGRSATQLPSEVEHLIGDRDGDLAAIQARDWDGVIDVAVYTPRWVRTLGDALRERVGHYAFVSTSAVYDHTHPTTLTEDSPTFGWADATTDPYSLSKPRGGHEYGALKREAEAEAERQFPNRTFAVRPGYIVGPGDEQDMFGYWIERMRHGGEVLAPGDPLQPVNFVDARDLAAFTVSGLERRLLGAFNTNGPSGAIGMAELLGAIRSVIDTDARLTWVNLPVTAWQDVLTPRDIVPLHFDPAIGMSTEKARAVGFTTRPVSETILNYIRWIDSLPVDDERRLGPVTSNDVADGISHQIRTPWPHLIKEQQHILERWRVHRSRF